MQRNTTLNTFAHLDGPRPDCYGIKAVRISAKISLNPDWPDYDEPRYLMEEMTAKSGIVSVLSLIESWEWDRLYIELIEKYKEDQEAAAEDRAQEQIERYQYEHADIHAQEQQGTYLLTHV